MGEISVRSQPESQKSEGLDQKEGGASLIPTYEVLRAGARDEDHAQSPIEKDDRVPEKHG